MIKIKTEELVKLKEQGMSDNQIAQHFSNQGIEIKTNTVAQRLYRYYKLQGKEKPSNISTSNYIKINGQETKNENPIKQMLMTGMTVWEKFPEKGQGKAIQDAIKTLEKLRLIALYSEKNNGEWLNDCDFALVTLYASGNERITERESEVNPWIQEGKLKKGKLNLIKDYCFGGNIDLMIYTLTRLNASYHIRDVESFKLFRKQYEEKIDKYLVRLQIVENGRRKNKENSENTNKDTIPEER